MKTHMPWAHDLYEAKRQESKSQNEELAARTSEKTLEKIVRQQIDESLDFHFKYRMPIPAYKDGLTFMHTVEGDRVLINPNDPFVAVHMLETGEWEPTIKREIKKVLSQGGCFIDVGANIGLHALYAAKLVGKNGRVLALEPHPTSKDILFQNMDINGLLDWVEVLQLAASDKAGEEVTFECLANHPCLSGIRVSEIFVKKYQDEVQPITVQTTTIDELVSKYKIAPDLIKIDVEGAEYNVFQGCVKTIKQHKNVQFIFEYTQEMGEQVMHKGVGQEIAAFFKEHGFKIYRIEEELHAISYEDFSTDEGLDYLIRR